MVSKLLKGTCLWLQLLHILIRLMYDHAVMLEKHMNTNCPLLKVKGQFLRIQNSLHVFKVDSTSTSGGQVNAID